MPVSRACQPSPNHVALQVILNIYTLSYVRRIPTKLHSVYTLGELIPLTSLMTTGTFSSNINIFTAPWQPIAIAIRQYSYLLLSTTARSTGLQVCTAPSYTVKSSPQRQLALTKPPSCSQTTAIFDSCSDLGLSPYQLLLISTATRRRDCLVVTSSANDMLQR